jgi:Spy/CpxP family protein refolding chaperone
MNDTDNSNPIPDGRPKRGRGRTILFGALFLGVAAVLTAGALQAFGFGRLHGGFCGSMDAATVEKKIDRVTGWVVEDLGGTPDQQAKLAAIAKAAAKDLAPIHDELEAGRAKAVEILTAKTIDRAALQVHRARQMELVEQAAERLTTAVADAADVLTPEQRVKAAEKLHDFHERMGHGAR